MGHTIVEVKNIYKEFGATKALTNVSLEIKSGEICGLIGENGSGKSTLSSIIAGIQPPTQGEMLNEGVYYAPTSPIEAQQKGIAMIVQEAGTIPNISITDNIYAGKEQYYLKGIFINKKKMTIDAKKALEKIGITNFDPRASLNTLSQEDRKIIEIARAMDEDPKLLIVDETTTALSLYGREVLYKIMEKMRDEDKSVIFISHDIDEVLAICDSVVILRDGQIVGKLSKEEMNPNIIRKMMVGREIRGDYYRGDFDRTISDQVVLEGRHITTEKKLRDIYLTLHKSEILGIGGLTESGIHDLGRVLFGIQKPIEGSVILKKGEKNYVIKNPWSSVRHGIGYVSKNRDEEALLLSTTIKNNIVLASLRKISKRGIVWSSKEKPMAQKEIEKLSIKCKSMDDNVNTLSGGNKQKVVFGKWLATEAEVLILDCPTRGVDIGVKGAMYSLIEELKKEGKSIVMISEELPELIGMSDRIMIIKNGKVAKEFLRSQKLTEHDIIGFMI